MLRVMRLPIASLPAEYRPILEELDSFVAMLPLDPVVKSLIAISEFDGDFVNFYANKQGGVEQISCTQSGPVFTSLQSQARLNYDSRRNILLNCPVDPKLPAAAYLKQILQMPQYMVVVDHAEPVIIPFVSAPGQAVWTSQQAQSKTGSGLLKWLLLLLLLAILGFGYWKFLYPWPFNQDVAAVKTTQEVNQPVSNVDPPQSVEPSQSLEQAQSTEQHQKLPQCREILQSGQLPLVFLAVDASASMILPMDDGSFRMNSALQAVKTLTERIDANIKIQLLGIHGCPVVKNYGVFAFQERKALVDKVQSIGADLYNTTTLIDTPLISAIQTIGELAPVDTDAAGIIISDGLDSCADTAQVDICQLAEQIHINRPRLKLHILYLGKEEDVQQISCAAKLTNGSLYRPENTEQLLENIKHASQTLVRICE